MSDRTLFALLMMGCLVLCGGCVDGGREYGSTGVSCAVSVPANWSAAVAVFMDGEENTFRITAADDGQYLAEFSNGTIVSDDGRRYRIYYPATGRAEIIPSTYAGAVWDGAGRPVRAMLYTLDLLKDALSNDNVTCSQKEETIEIAGDGVLGFAPTRMRDAIYLMTLSVDPDTDEMQSLALLDREESEVMALTFENFTAVAVSDDAFSFVPPEGTETVMMQTYAVTPIHVTTPEAAVRCFNATLPDLPPEYTFVEGSCLPALSTVLVYRKNEMTFRITLRPADLPYPNPPMGQQVETVAVNGQEGIYYQGNGTNTLVWADEATMFRIEGKPGKEEMMLVAASLGASR